MENTIEVSLKERGELVYNHRNCFELYIHKDTYIIVVTAQTFANLSPNFYYFEPKSFIPIWPNLKPKSLLFLPFYPFSPITHSAFIAFLLFLLLPAIRLLSLCPIGKIIADLSHYPSSQCTHLTIGTVIHHCTFCHRSRAK